MMNKCPNKYTLDDLLAKLGAKLNPINMVCIKGDWYPARPLGYYSIYNRFLYSWMVFTGKADILVWPEDELGGD